MVCTDKVTKASTTDKGPSLKHIEKFKYLRITMGENADSEMVVRARVSPSLDKMERRVGMFSMTS